MRAWLILATENAVVVIDAIALVIIVFGTIEAFLTSVRAVLSTPDGPHRRDIWLRYGRWLLKPRADGQPG